MSTIPLIQASADHNFNITLAERIARLKDSFGLPAWITGKFTKHRPPQGHRQVVAKLIEKSAPALTFQEQVQAAAEQMKKLPPNVFVVVPKNQAVATPAPVSVPVPAVITGTTKERIMAYMNEIPRNSGHIHDIQAALSDIAPGGVSSRVSQLVKSGQLVALGLGVYELNS